MGMVLVILLILIVLMVGASLALGRTTYEVERARDTEYLELEGSWVRYNVMGGGPPVVLVHGWLTSSRIWKQLATRLAQRFTVYTLDLNGFGESDKPLSGYGIRYGSRLLYAFCAHFGLTRASVIGHDFGGNMAVKLAADHPDVVGQLVLVSVPANEEQVDLPTPLWLATLPLVGPIFYTLGRLFRPVRRLWMRPFVADPESLDEDVVEDAGSSTPAAVGTTLGVARREISGGRLARQARIIKAPALIIAGEEDQIVDPQSSGVWARSLDQAEVCLLEDCGHMPMIERVSEFNAQILAFLTGDARYLDYVERPSAEEETEIEEETGPIETAGPETGSAGAAPEDAEPQPDEELTEGEPPKIVRGLDGVDLEEERGAEAEEGREPPEETPGPRQRRRRTGGGNSGEGMMPEMPEDLFNWPESLKESRPGESRSRRRNHDDEEKGEPGGS